MVLVAILSVCMCVRVHAWFYKPQMRCQAYFNNVHANDFNCVYYKAVLTIQHCSTKDNNVTYFNCVYYKAVLTIQHCSTKDNNATYFNCVYYKAVLTIQHCSTKDNNACTE